VTRRDRALARRLSSLRDNDAPQRREDGADAARQVASLPTVVDLVARRDHSRLPVTDDLDDVFDRYYAERPDEVAFEVFDE
jgi:putative transposase